MGFLAVEPARAEQVAFTAPYVLIEGVYAVPDDSPLRTVADVDAAGVRIGVKLGSAYDLFLTRTLARRPRPRRRGRRRFLAEGLEVAAGIRQPMTAFVAAHGGVRLIEERFMEIRQAMATTRSRAEATVEYLRAFVEEQKASGFVAAASGRAGRPTRRWRRPRLPGWRDRSRPAGRSTRRRCPWTASSPDRAGTCSG